MRYCDHHLLAGDEVLVFHVGVGLNDLGPTGCRVGCLDLDELVADDLKYPIARGENLKVALDLLGQLVELIGNLVASQRGETLQAKIENGARLLFREIVGAVVVHFVARIVDQAD